MNAPVPDAPNDAVEHAGPLAPTKGTVAGPGSPSGSPTSSVSVDLLRVEATSLVPLGFTAIAAFAEQEINRFTSAESAVYESFANVEENLLTNFNARWRPRYSGRDQCHRCGKTPADFWSSRQSIRLCSHCQPLFQSAEVHLIARLDAIPYEDQQARQAARRGALKQSASTLRRLPTDSLRTIRQGLDAQFQNVAEARYEAESARAGWRAYLRTAAASALDRAQQRDIERAIEKRAGDLGQRRVDLMALHSTACEVWTDRLVEERDARMKALGGFPPRYCTVCYVTLQYFSDDDSITCGSTCQKVADDLPLIEWGTRCAWCNRHFRCESHPTLEWCSRACLIASPEDLEEHRLLLSTWPVMEPLVGLPATLAERRRLAQPMTDAPRGTIRLIASKHALPAVSDSRTSHTLPAAGSLRRRVGETPPVEHVRVFLDTCTVRDAGGWESSKKLFEAYRHWARSVRRPALSPRALGLALRELGLRPHKQADRGWRGFRFRDGSRTDA